MAKSVVLNFKGVESLKIIKKIERAIKNPILIKHKILKLIDNTDKPKIKKIYSISYTLEKHIKHIKLSNYKKILMISNEKNFEKLFFHFKKEELTWCSSNYEDINNGAVPINAVNFKLYDAILINSKNTKNDYRFVLKEISEFKIIPKVMWVENDFEFCGGTIPLSKKCDDLDVVIFNHFGLYFGIWDPLLVKIEIFNSKEMVSFQKIIKPNASFCFKVSEYLKIIDDTTCVYHSCEHPNLTFKRHNRWRSVGIYHWKNSKAMVHSAHDFSKKLNKNEFKICLDLIKKGELSITLPNYSPFKDNKNENFKTLKGKKISTERRSLSHRIEELSFDKSINKKNKGFFGVDYSGFGGSFWFGFEKTNKSNNTIIANHTSRSYLIDSEITYKDFNNNFKKEFSYMSQIGLFLTPFCLPIDIDDENLEFGFEFDSNSPSLNHFVYKAYDKNGVNTLNGGFTKKNSGVLYSSDLLKELELSENSLSTIILSPDWLKHKLNPEGKGPVGQLIIRNKQTLDKDVTEYQSCWRNNQIIIDHHPHWLFPSKMLLGGSKLYCGFSGLSSKTDIYLSLLNGSGNINYSKKAIATVSLINEIGETINFNIELLPFVNKTFSITKYQKNWKKHFSKNFGNIIVMSKDADINANIVTKDGKSVTLQHMWGY